LSVGDEYGNIFGENAEDVGNVLKLVLPKPPQKADAVTVFGCIDSLNSKLRNSVSFRYFICWGTFAANWKALEG